jgi:hypothetical protein
MYRIVTERKNVDSIKQALCGYGLDYTLLKGEGSWHGQVENSLIIELDNISKDVAQTAAQAIKRINSQETVLLQEIAVSSQFI